MEEITIPMEEYKELLITKGKYEELKCKQIVKPSYIGIRDLSKNYTVPSEQYKITCNKED